MANERVFKLGGAVIGSPEKSDAAAASLAAGSRRGERAVVIVSAAAGETDRLLAAGRALGGDHAELDVLAATGEQAAAALFALKLQSLGRSARSFLGHELPLRTDAFHGDAGIVAVECASLRAALDRGEIPVIAGFQGVSPEGRITTLGRGGSDTTAVAVAAALQAQECVFLKDVDGVRSADPSVCPGAPRIDRIAFRHMLALSKAGAKVLHSKCVAMAMQRAVSLFVTDSLDSREGTRITPSQAVAFEPQIVAIAAQGGQLSVIGDFPLLTRSRISRFARARLAEVGIASRSASEDGVVLSIEVAPALASAALRCLHTEFCTAVAPTPFLHWREA